MQYQNIILLGGSGFIGRSLAFALADKGCRVTIPCRRPHRQQALKIHPNIRVVAADVLNENQLDPLCSGQHAIINLIGILHQRQAHDFRRVHVDFIKSLVTICLRNNIHRVLHLSALGANEASSPSLYLRSKGEGENLLHTFGHKNLQITSFQPSVVFGKHDQFINRFAALVNSGLLLFPLACPNSLLAPVYVGDLVDRIVAAVDDRSTHSKRFTICGPEVFTLQQIIELIIKASASSCRVLPLGDTLSKLQAVILQSLPGKLFTLDNYHSLQTPNICQQGELCQTGLRQYLEGMRNRFGNKKHYDQYRRDCADSLEPGGARP